MGRAHVDHCNRARARIPHKQGVRLDDRARGYATTSCHRGRRTKRRLASRAATQRQRISLATLVPLVEGPRPDRDPHARPFWNRRLLFDPLGTGSSLSAIILQSLAWALLLSGTAVRLWATLYIGTSKGKKLICEGPYSLCRNPLYVGTFFITLSIPAFLQSPIFAVGVILSSTLYLWATMPFEEEQLRRHFGQEYLDYCRQTPRFMPRFRHWNSPPTVETNVRALRIEAVRALRWMLIPIITQVVYQIQIGNL